MRDRYTAFLLSFLLIGALGMGLFIKPTESQAKPQRGWKAEYFPNTVFSGPPVLVTWDEKIDMNWADSAPYIGLPIDGFSVRWTQTVKITEGIYQFRIGADDAVRLWIDGELTLDSTHTGQFNTIQHEVWLDEGKHEFRVEYYEIQGLAGVLVEWQRVR